MQQVHAKKSPDKQLRAPKNKTEDEPDLSRRSQRTWKDAKIGLEWQFKSPGEISWHEAMEYAKSLSLDGKNDWRLPTLAELETLLDRSILYDKLRPVMRKQVPFQDTLSYWSSTTFAPDTSSAWIVMF
jgi:formylglycine-generating enzyme required for sulfatase activity